MGDELYGAEMPDLGEMDMEGSAHTKEIENELEKAGAYAISNKYEGMRRALSDSNPRAEEWRRFLLVATATS